MNLYMFWAVPLPITGDFINCTLGTGICHSVWSQLTSRAGMELHPGPARKLTSNQMTCTSAKCIVDELLMMGRGTARNM